MNKPAYNLIFRDHTRKPMPLDASQGGVLKVMLKGSSDSFFELPDGEIIQKYEIKGLRVIKESGTHALAGRTTTCEYGKKHEVQEDCNCRQEEWNGAIWLTVWDHFKEIKPGLMYNSDITEEMIIHAKSKMLQTV